MGKVKVFKNTKGQQEYYQLYAHTLQLWPVPYTELDIETSFGTTHIIASGNEDAFPVLLLSGMATSAAMWFENIRSLTDDFRVYALDTLGDVGKSQPVRVPKTPEEWSEWLAEVMQGLGIQKAHVAGLSFGGWLTMVLALYRPELVEKAVVLAPAGGLVSLRWQFFLKVFPAMLLPSTAVKRKSVLWFAHQKGQIPERFIRQFVAAYQHGKFKLAPTIFTNEELQRIQVPVLLLIGREEVVFQLDKAVKRAQANISDITVRLVKDASHCLPIEQPGVVNGYIKAFLAG